MAGIDQLKLTLYGDNGTNVVAVAAWRNFVNKNCHCFEDELRLLDQYNARYGYNYSELIFKTEEDRLYFLMTWS